MLFRGEMKFVFDYCTVFSISSGRQVFDSGECKLHERGLGGAFLFFDQIPFTSAGDYPRDFVHLHLHPSPPNVFSLLREKQKGVKNDEMKKVHLPKYTAPPKRYGSQNDRSFERWIANDLTNNPLQQ